MIDTSKMIPDHEYIIGEETWAKCSGCYRVIKTSGFFGSLHVCSEENAKKELKKRVYEK